MKKLHYLLVCVAAMLASLNFVSCSSDNGGSEDADASALVGTWIVYDGYDIYDYEAIMFCADGTVCEFEESDNRHRPDVEKGRYAYDSRKQIITLYWEDEVVVVDVISLTKSKLTTRFVDGKDVDIETFTKISDPYTAKELEAYYKAQR